MRKKLEADREDEAEAIKTYGKRQKQMPAHAGQFAEMQRDEKDHFKKLSKIMAGLKKAGPDAS